MTFRFSWFTPGLKEHKSYCKSISYMIMTKGSKQINNEASTWPSEDFLLNMPMIQISMKSMQVSYFQGIKIPKGFESYKMLFSFFNKKKKPTACNITLWFISSKLLYVQCCDGLQIKTKGIKSINSFIEHSHTPTVDRYCNVKKVHWIPGLSLVLSRREKDAINKVNKMYGETEFGDGKDFMCKRIKENICRN